MRLLLVEQPTGHGCTHGEPSPPSLPRSLLNATDTHTHKHMHQSPPSSKQQAARALMSSGGSRQHRYTATPHATCTAGTAAVSAAAVEGGSSGVAPELGQQQSMTDLKAMPSEKETNDEGGNGESAVEEKKKGNDESHDSLHLPPPSSLSSSYSSSCSISSSSSLTTTCSSSSCPLSIPLSGPARPVVPASLDGGHGKVSPKLSAATAHALPLRLRPSAGQTPPRPARAHPGMRTAPSRLPRRYVGVPSSVSPPFS